MLSLNQLQLQRAVQLLALQNHAVFVQFQRVSANDLKALDVLELIHPGPQGPAGPIGPSGDAAGLPTGGDPGNILMKTTNANYASNLAATLDGGTFN